MRCLRLYCSLMHEAAKPDCDIERRTVKCEFNGRNVAAVRPLQKQRDNEGVGGTPQTPCRGGLLCKGATTLTKLN
jgi:hypothetical protein